MLAPGVLKGRRGVTLALSHVGAMARRGEPFSSPGHASEPPKRRLARIYIYERKTEAVTAEQEPMGIVISRGPRNEKAPDVLRVHVGPGPEGDEEAIDRARVA